jgi:predicted transposase YbfD/YdcC
MIPKVSRACPRIPAVLAKLGPLNADTITDLRPFLNAVPDPRSRRGCWCSLTCILPGCACAAISGAKSVDALAEWGQRAHDTVLAAIGVRPHPLAWRRSPSAPTIDRVLCQIDGGALDTAIGAYLADRHQGATNTDDTDAEDAPAPRLPAIALDGKALKGSAHLEQRCRYLLSAITHHLPVTLAQPEVSVKTNETRHFRPLLQDLDLAGHVVTFDALHTVKDHLTRLVETKNAHYVAVIKTNQSTAHQQISALPWSEVPIAHTRSGTGHGRVESRSIKVMGSLTASGGSPSLTPNSRSASTAAANGPVRSKHSLEQRVERLGQGVDRREQAGLVARGVTGSGRPVCARTWWLRAGNASHQR